MTSLVREETHTGRIFIFTNVLVRVYLCERLQTDLTLGPNPTPTTPTQHNTPNPSVQPCLHLKYLLTWDLKSILPAARGLPDAQRLISTPVPSSPQAICPFLLFSAQVLLFVSHKWWQVFPKGHTAPLSVTIAHHSSRHR